MKYLRYLVPFIALSCAFAFLLPEATGVKLPPGFLGFVMTATLGAVFALIYNGYKAVEPALVKRFTGQKVRYEHIFYGGFLGMVVLSSLALVALSSFTTLVTVAGTLGVVKAGFYLALIGTALVPSPSLRKQHEETATEPKPEPAEQPAPAVVPTTGEQTAAPVVVPTTGEQTAAPAVVPTTGDQNLAPAVVPTTGEQVVDTTGSKDTPSA